MIRYNGKHGCVKALGLSIIRVKELKLVVDDAVDGPNCDHANWGTAKIWK